MPPSSDALKGVIVDYVRDGRMPFTAARTAGVKSDTFSAWRKDDRAFAEAIDTAISEYAEEIEGVILRASLALDVFVPKLDEETGEPHPYLGMWEAQTPDGKRAPSKDAVAAAEKWLKARERTIWSPNATVDVNHRHTIELTTPDDIRKLTAELQKRMLPAGETGEPDIVDGEVLDD